MGSVSNVTNGGKVVVPKYVAEVIEHLRDRDYRNYEIFTVIEEADFLSPTILKAKDWAFEYNGGSPDLLMQALVNGWEVERTPYEELREYFDANITGPNPELVAYGRHGRRRAVVRTLEIHGVAVEGINDN